eukprot:TRINITY_DN8656_c0_g1_i1.p1 TRINITY_DN8656_c0_g1~~TRINITY_DN8656_c0_g1_i1.p1  ORF type:complete len:318 (-),score=68.06 TRINITY_DN8656_c0_g1_i1:126-1079(-)
MSRHAKNNTASSYFTYHERQKLDYGTKSQRLGKDSLQPFDCCCLTLHPVSSDDAVVTPEGFLFSREAILENLLEQKQAYQRKLQAWEEQVKEIEQEQAQQQADQQAADVRKFEAIETSLLPVSAQGYEKAMEEKRVEETIPDTYRAKLIAKDLLKTVDRRENEAIVQHREDPAKVLKAFWIPGVQEAVKRIILEKPSSVTLCPKSRKPLRVKQLVRATFTPLNNARGSDSSKLGRWMCPLCYTPLTNKISLALLRTSSKILCKTCVDNLVRPEMRDPINAKVMRSKDIIYLKSGGTGYAGKEDQENLVATKFDIAFQ